MKPKPRRRVRPRPMQVRYETQRQTIARLLLLGWTAERVARKMGCTARAIRYHISTPEFEALYGKLQREYLQRVDRKLGSLLNGAVDALERMLRHKDWKARDAALQHIFKIHGKYVERFDITGTLDPRGQVRHVEAELVEGPMSDEMRAKATELLQLQRQAIQKSLPARFVDRHIEQHPVNGRLVRQNQDPDHDGEEA
jgi:hypothetical protein